jgi:hypothetical protein
MHPPHTCAGEGWRVADGHTRHVRLPGSCGKVGHNTRDSDLESQECVPGYRGGRALPCIVYQRLNT